MLSDLDALPLSRWSTTGLMSMGDCGSGTVGQMASTAAHPQRDPIDPSYTRHLLPETGQAGRLGAASVHPHEPWHTHAAELPS